MKFGHHSKIISPFDFVSMNYELSQRYEMFNCQSVELDIFNKQGYVVGLKEYGIQLRARRNANTESYLFSDRHGIDNEY